MKSAHRKLDAREIRIGNDDTTLRVHSCGGGIRGLDCGDLGITLSTGLVLDRSTCLDFFLTTGDGEVFSLLGFGNDKEFHYGKNVARWEGSAGLFRYTVSFHLPPGRSTKWFWEVSLTNTGQESLMTELTYYMDKALAPREIARSNEYYNSHYLDCTKLTSPVFGTVLATRQNRDVVQGSNPWLLEGCFQGCGSFATDAEVFFGREHRTTGIPKALSRKWLSSRVVQGQYALSALRAFPDPIGPGKTRDFVFFTCMEPDHVLESSDKDLDSARAARSVFVGLGAAEYTDSISFRASDTPFARPVSGSRLDISQVCELFGSSWDFPEYGADGELLSFFCKGSHVVMAEKDRQIPAAHGHILRSGSQILPDDHILSTNCFMDGCFAAMMALGNTNFNTFVSSPRSLHGLSAANGIRIAVDNGSGFRLLKMPSVFLMARRYVQWIYLLGGDRIIVRVEMDELDPEYRLSVRVEGSDPPNCRFLLFLFLEEAACRLATTKDLESPFATIFPASGTGFHQRFPGVEIRMDVDSPFPEVVERISSDGFSDTSVASDGFPLIAVETIATNEVSLKLRAGIPDHCHTISRADKGGTVDEFLQTPELFGIGSTSSASLGKVKETMDWFAQNALVHLSVLHGLDQTKGAALGVRDVLQGPFEALLARENWTALKEILLIVFMAQNKEGTWPQWFMLDAYHDHQDPHAHGDIIFWPLKALGEYLEESNDRKILSVERPFADAVSGRPVGPSLPLTSHIEKALDIVENLYLIPSSGLLRYGGGDWNDTLQPVDQKVKDGLVSTWTMGLAVQYLDKLAKLLMFSRYDELGVRISTLADKIKRAVQRNILVYNPIPGFLRRDSETTPLLHPADGESAPNFRLLPMIRFINAHLFSKEEARVHLKHIEQHLWYPDGVHLLDRPVEYKGGPSSRFIRAEQSAFWGREVGLMYVHAHLRFVEALLNLGEGEKAWKALEQVSPVDLRKVVPNAEPRQANAYFSSSDAAFNDRYEAIGEYESLRNASRACRGGWRVYSSGPGIYLSLLRRWFFGFRFASTNVVIDPVIPGHLRGCGVTLRVFQGKRLTMRWYPGETEGCGVNAIVLNDRPLQFLTVPHPYRRGGALVDRVFFDFLLDRQENKMEVYLGDSAVPD